jgi:PAS domain-containing protein
MFFEFHDLTEARKNIPADAEQGLLEVEVPHWTAQVRIYDGLFRPVSSVGKVKEKPPNTKRYVSETVLAPGIYKVEVSVDGQSVSESIPVRSKRISRVHQSPKAWNKLRVSCAAPLDETASRREWHTYPAEEWSHNTTWTKFENSDSHLFLFVRTLQPEKYKSFAEGLSLWDADGKPITDFRDGVEVNTTHGWLAFSANLPAGGYILRRGRRGVRLRHQPIYLCKDWETQVFLISKQSPSLRKMTLNMARRGHGFRHDDDSAVAAQAVFSSLRQGTSHRQLVMSEKMDRLLKGKFENPWFGILAAYTLSLVQEESQQPSASTRAELSDDPEIARLLQKVLGFLDAEVSEHPDVRALNLKENKTPHEAFPFPPLLWLGLKRVQRHATLFAETVPFDSLTDSVLENVLTDSPWTAWRELERPLRQERARPERDAPEEDIIRTIKKAVGRSKRESPTKTDFPAMILFAQTAQARTPVFRLASSSEDVESDPPRDLSVAGKSASAAANFAADVLTDAPLIQTVKNLVESHELKDLPEKISFDSSRALDEILLRAEYEPERISAAAGVPLSRVEQGLQRLRQQSEGAAPEQEFGWKGSATESAAQTVLQYALLNTEQSTPTAPTDVSTAPEADAPPDANAPTLSELTTAAECAAQIRVEAARLASAALDETGRVKRRKSVRPPSAEEKARAKELADRLDKVADLLLGAADFVAVTTPQGHILYGNGAFLSLLSRTGEQGAEAHRRSKSARKTNQQLWENILSPHPPGQSTIDDPARGGVSWELKRTAIEDESSGEVRAYVNGLWQGGASPVTPEALSEMRELLPNLTLYTSLFSYGTNADKRSHLARILELTNQLEQLSGAAEPQKGKLMTTNDAMNDAQPDEPELTMPYGTLYGREFWGISRHILIAGTADHFLSANARKEVERILAPIETVSLADIASWADDVKRHKPDPTKDDPETVKFLKDPRNSKHGTWHYVNVPHGATKYSRTAYPKFTRDDDVVQMLRASVKVLKGESDRFSELNALRLVTHLVGDVHQPVHVGCSYIDKSGELPRLVSDPAAAVGLESDIGGNSLILPIPGSVPLHTYWDSRLLPDDEDHDHDDAEADAPSESDAPEADAASDADAVSPELKARFIQKLVNQIEANASEADVEMDETSGPVEDWPEAWATTSIRLARNAYESLRIVKKLTRQYKVEWEGKETYDARCKPIARQQADAAARHLADLLNKIWE